MRKVTIHQPQYLPWPAYFEKILNSDIFILLDDVQFQKNGLQNRNKIKTPQGESWLTLPVKHSFGQLIKDVEINNPKIKEKHLRSLQMSYSKSENFQNVFDMVSSVLSMQTNFLCEISSVLIKKILELFKYDGEIINSSDIGVEGKGSELILNLCEAVDADNYLSGGGGVDYLNRVDFEQAEIEVIFQNFKMPEYSQCFSKLGFIPNLSAIDLLFNEGENSKEIINSGSCNYLSWDEIN